MTASVRITGALLTTMAFAIPITAAAQTLHIQPALIDASHSVEQALDTHKGHASTTIEGAGGILTIDYQSTEPLEVYMVPLQQGGSYVLTDTLYFTLPMTTQGTVEIDLTVSPGWSPANKKWQINLLSTDEKTGAAFTGINFRQESTSTTVLAALRHLFTKEAYTPSSYHALRGYRMLGYSFTEILGGLTVVASLLCFVMFRKKYGIAMLAAMIVGSLLYQARFSIDLLRFTLQHTREYPQGSYDEAGSIHAVGGVLRGLVKDPKHLTIYSCRDGTNFKEKLLRYFSYPIRVSSESGATLTAQYAVVMDKFKWGFETSITKDASTVTLKCGDLNRKAQKLTTFPSGEILFRLLP